MLAFTTPFISQAQAQSEEEDDLHQQLQHIEEELARIKKEKQDVQHRIANEKSLQGTLVVQISTFSNNILLLELDIQEKEADILKKETEIKIAEEEITDARHLIESIERDVDELELNAGNIIRNIYIQSRTNSVIDILLRATEGKSYASNIQYHTALGKYDQQSLKRLESEKDELQEQKAHLEENKIEIEKLTEQIRIQKEGLEKDKEQHAAQIAQKNKLLNNSRTAAEYYGQLYENLSDEEMKKEAELDRILQQIVQSATKPKGYTVNGNIIATEGNNGCSTGPHTHFAYSIGPNNWVDPCSHLPSNSFWWGTCSGDGSISYPYKGTFYSSRGYSWYHKAIDLNAGADKNVYAAHDGYYFEETPPCSNNWCSVGCKSATNPCVKVCEDVDCKTGKITIYCHVNFLPG